MTAMLPTKRQALDEALPANSVIDYGGARHTQYIEYASKMSPVSVFVDGTKPDNCEALGRTGIRFIQGDFSNGAFYREQLERYDLGLAFDVILHQFGPLDTLKLMLSTVDRMCISQPCIRTESLLLKPFCMAFMPALPTHEQPAYLPSHELAKVYPSGFFPDGYTRSLWMWAMKASLVSCWVEREGFVVVKEWRCQIQGSEHWEYWSCYCKRETTSHTNQG